MRQSPLSLGQEGSWPHTSLRLLESLSMSPSSASASQPSGDTRFSRGSSEARPKSASRRATPKPVARSPCGQRAGGNPLPVGSDADLHGKSTSPGWGSRPGKGCSPPAFPADPPQLSCHTQGQGVRKGETQDPGPLAEDGLAGEGSHTATLFPGMRRPEVRRDPACGEAGP